MSVTIGSISAALLGRPVLPTVYLRMRLVQPALSFMGMAAQETSFCQSLARAIFFQLQASLSASSLTKACKARVRLLLLQVCLRMPIRTGAQTMRAMLSL